MPNLQQLWDSFLKRWPKEKLNALTLEQYVSVNNSDTFTYWLETKTKPLGSIQGNTSAKFGIYKRSGEANEQKGIAHGQVYSWRIKYGTDEETAFQYVKQCLIKIIESVETGDLEQIEQIDLSAMVKWKVAFLYQNQHKPSLINIFSKPMLAVLFEEGANTSFPDLYRKMVAQKGERDLLQYGEESWQQANSKIRARKQDMILSKFEHVLVFRRNLVKWNDEIKAAFCKLIETAHQQNLDIFTTNMTSGDMIRIGRKEIDMDSAVSVFATFTPGHQSILYSQRFKYRDEGYYQEAVKEQLIINIIKSEDISEFNKQYPITRKPYWPENFIGEYDADNEGKIDPEDSSEGYSMTNNIPLNQILYGPPGTGKTYSTINKALAILDPECLDINSRNRDVLKARFDELLKSNRIGFVTFHQSFSYEDFVEGIKADTEDGQVHYSIEDGIFKSMCEAASIKIQASSEVVDIDVSKRNIWKMSLGDTLGDDAYIYQQCIDNDYIVLGYGYKIDFSSANTRKEIMNIYNENGAEITNASRDYNVTSVYNFKHEMAVGDLIVVSDGNHKFRAIAEITSDYYFEDVVSESSGYSQCRKVKWHKIFSQSVPKDELLNNNFSQMTLYRLRPPAIDLDKLQGFFNETITSDESDVGSQSRVLIIDEINRGNIANIFGELITLIEPSKRAGGSESLSVKLPYSKKPFTVPSNLHIIGTMNTADKSLAQVDIALRRRFEFIEMMPDYSVLEDIPDIDGINIRQLLETINQRIELLYDREHMIGHSFFLSLKETPTITNLAQIFELQILPLLEEYFFEDWERVGQVLGDHLKGDQSLHFIIEKFDSNTVIKLMGGNWEQTGIQPYQRNHQALNNPQAYIGIYETITSA